MTVGWKFEDGCLQAHSESGLQLRSWMATEAMGLPLAALLDQSQDLSRLLLWPLLEPKEGVTEPDVLSLGRVAGHHGGKRAAELPEE